MLLPSAFCDGGGAAQAPQRPQRPKLPSFSAYQPQYSTNARLAPLSSSCRALQAILGGPLTVSNNNAHAAPNLRDRFQHSEQAVTQQIPATPRRNPNKRRRSEFEEDLVISSSDVRMDDYRTPEPVRTPKRRRRVPLSMPMGLSADDFRSLDTPTEEVELEMPPTSTRDMDQDSAYGSSPLLEDEPWTAEDDRLLVDTILEKMKLSRRDWNDCARRIGKDRDSLERRWSILLGDGNVGLRRGGRMSRTSLEISSW
jgi:hypothetical protein